MPEPSLVGSAHSGVGLRPRLVIISLLSSAYWSALSSLGTLVAFWKEYWAYTERLPWPSAPRLVLIITTPLAPREP